tara:strand:- start:103 stop:525 length:423 start_codon:yes stop_codon:yes gene_type:complete
MKDEDKDSLDTLLIAQHQKEIWEWKQREAQWIRDKNQLDGNKQIVRELSEKLVKIVQSNLELKKKLTEAEGETSLVKAIGVNSPEMKALKQINDDHQKYNGELQMSLTNLEQRNIEIHTDNIKLSKQIEDLLIKLKNSER